MTAVRRKELPEMDDEWAKSLGEEFESLEDLRQKVREDLEKRAGVESDNRLRGEVMRKLVEAHPFEVPQTLERAPGESASRIGRARHDRARD